MKNSRNILGNHWQWVVALMLLLAFPGAGLGDTYTVSTTTDGGSGSLRQAIIDANAHPGADTISLPAGTYTLVIQGRGEDAAATGDLDISGDLAIAGAGVDTTIIDASGIDRVLHVLSGTVSLSGLTVRNGSVVGSGGGILNAGNLTLTNVKVTQNLASSGGGVFNEGGAPP